MAENFTCLCTFPLQRWMHVDMNAYFAALEQQANPLLRGKPIGIVGSTEGGRSIVVAASYEAKRYGVKNGMPYWEARKLCPSLRLVRGDPEKYRWAHKRLRSLFLSLTPHVEIFSIDEAFLQFTPPSPSLSSLCQPARQLKQKIRRQLGEKITCSIGIAPTRILAKVASSSRKPDGLTVLSWPQARTLLQRLAVDEICGIGPKLAGRLHNLGIHYAATLSKFPLPLLQKIFGPTHGYNLHRLGHGLDPLHFSKNLGVFPQSISHSYTAPRLLSTPLAQQQLLYKLCVQVAERLRKSRLRAASICATFDSFSLKASLLPPSYDDRTFFHALVKQLSGCQLPPVRWIRVSASKLSHCWQPSLWHQEGEKEKLTDAVGKIRKRYGDWVLTLAFFLPALSSGRQKHAPLFLPPVGGFPEKV
jgi:DNA polymerase-4